ncbi:leucine-rich repeat extensin-like protein 5 [Micropterus salmoides]|uniref:leucine-rich repeat extensin-like protein 5 n=1 Tax=Micropterus salmoides TaxID=27706 RepID=UPI0018EB9027|nr:leucine-rich repeat extensin-like protein 5 [Micropterus salmoides]
MVHPPIKVPSPPTAGKAWGHQRQPNIPHTQHTLRLPCNANQTSNDATTNHPSPPARPEPPPPRVQAEPAAPELRRPEACPGPGWGPSPPQSTIRKGRGPKPTPTTPAMCPRDSQMPHCESKCQPHPAPGRVQGGPHT